MRIRHLLPAALLLAACNSTLKGEPAPAIPGDGWLQADGREASLATGGQWVLAEFFSPN